MQQEDVKHTNKTTDIRVCLKILLFSLVRQKLASFFDFTWTLKILQAVTHGGHTEVFIQNPIFNWGAVSFLMVLMDVFHGTLAPPGDAL